MAGFTALPDAGSTDPKKIARGNRQFIYQQGQDLINQAGQQAGQSEADRNAYLDSTNAIENQAMAGQGGYTPEEAAGIRGDPSSYTKYFNPDQMNQTLADSQAKQDQAVSGLKQGLDSSIDPSQLSQSEGYRARLRDSLQGEAGNIGQAVVNEKGELNAAVDPSKLGLAKNFTNNYLMSPEEQQRIVTGAGISAGQKDRQAVDSLEMQARAAGSDPMGVAAYRARMGRQEAADAGDAMTQARIGASNAAAARQQTNEAMRLGSEQDISSRQQQNVRDVTQTGIGAQETVAQQEQQAATQEELNRQAAQQYITGAKLQSATTGGEAALQNTENQTQQTQQQQQFNTGVGTNIAQSQDVNASNRNTNIANTRIGQQNTAVASQNAKAGMFNQNQQGAYGRQQQAYGTQTGGLTSSANTSQNASQNPTGLDKAIGAAAGVAGAFLDEGGVISQPTVATLGEHGPEAVVPVGGQTPWWKRMGQSGPGIAESLTGNKPGVAPYAQLGENVGGLFRGLRQKQQVGAANRRMSGAMANPYPGSLQGPMQNSPDVGYNPMDNAPANQSPMARGSVVTRPTVAMLGDKGPEAVVPLNNKPGNKVKPSMLFGRRAYGEAA